jgi:hypothetical protein
LDSRKLATTPGSYLPQQPSPQDAPTPNTAAALDLLQLKSQLPFKKRKLEQRPPSADAMASSLDRFMAKKQARLQPQPPIQEVPDRRLEWVKLLQNRPPISAPDATSAWLRQVLAVSNREPEIFPIPEHPPPPLQQQQQQSHQPTWGYISD